MTADLPTSSVRTGEVAYQSASSNFSLLEQQRSSRIINDSAGSSETETLSFAPSANREAGSSRLGQEEGDATSSLGPPVLESQEHRAVPLQDDWLKFGTSHRTGQKIVAQVFPKSWKDFDEQCGSEANADEPWNTMPWMARKGRVWVAEPEVPDALTLVACAAYPRDQSPTEAEAAARRFETALRMIKEREEAASPREAVSRRLSPRSGTSKGKSPLCAAEMHVVQDPSQRKLRIITHAMGSFEGHPDAAVFATGLSAGLERFQFSV
ncbi:hypothetical protein CYMTET_20657 [Cymbomonas tetramitiformis]|uniref:Uncharacterized protein n=1 Tax=Cymbomonas tetramitiformis TaxID=36881 RepID=A0AAE0G3R8_9CHLO|nr:hypothetical protein CYMTET_20657 [Cymbomonas tetramitiformis]